MLLVDAQLPGEMDGTGPTPSFEARDSGVSADADPLLEMACRYGLRSRDARNRLTYGSDVFLFAASAH